MITFQLSYLLRNSISNTFLRLIKQNCQSQLRTFTFISSCDKISTISKVSIKNSRSLMLSSSLKKNSVTIIFLKDDGTQVKRRAHVGDTIQELVEDNDPEIEGFGVCGGVTACSTCHVIIPKEVFKLLEEPTSDEEDLLSFAPEHCETSRLGCNVKIIKEMDGVVIKVPSQRMDQRETT